MTGIKRQSEKHLILASGRAFPELADEVASLLGVDLVPTRALTYANSEIYVRFEESVRGADAFVIQSHPAPVNEWLMEQLIMIDALKRASAKRITVVSPFYPYGRQDKKHAGREPISARLIADLYKTAGADRLMSIDLHASQIQGFFDGPVDHLIALPVLEDFFHLDDGVPGKVTGPKFAGIALSKGFVHIRKGIGLRGDLRESARLRRRRFLSGKRWSGYVGSGYVGSGCRWFGRRLGRDAFGGVLRCGF